jgi:hypothetical protein
MTSRQVLACVMLLALIGGARLAAQRDTAEVQTAAGVHTVIFRTSAGTVRVQVAADAAPGDTLSGVVQAEPAGASPQEKAQNLAQLNGMVLATAGGEAAVSKGQYAWVVPITTRGGRFDVSLRPAQGRAIAVASVPIDGVPAPAVSGASVAPFEMPAAAQAGQPAIIRGAFSGRLDRLTVRLGAVAAQLLAVSPRRVVLAVPGNAVGRVPMTVTADGRTAEGILRVLAVRLSVTATQLAKGQTATLTGEVTGLQGIDVATTLALSNQSADVVRVQDGDVQVITIKPSDVTPSGTFALTRTLTGVRPGAFRITLLANRAPLSLFDVTVASERVLAGWVAATGVLIAPDTRALIERSILDASVPLQQFLTLQQVNRGDARDVFAALLSHYCFDLRDEQSPARNVAAGQPSSAFRPISFAQPRIGQREITPADVRRLSFAEFLNTLLARFSGAQPVGYLLITSMPASSGITIDGQRKSEMTNRRFVTSTGEHAIVVAAPSRTCRQRVQVGAYQTAVVSCGS